MKSNAFLVGFAVASLLLPSSAEMMDRPGGIKVGERMKINPYVSVGYTLDSNIDSARREDIGSSFSVSPGFSFVYNADRWNLSGSVYGNYHVYTGKYSDELSNFGFGESVGWSYSDIEDGKGWSATIRESYSKVLQDDDASNNEGKGIGRDRDQITVSAGLNRRFNDQLHCGIDGSMYYVDYANNLYKYAPLYGWSRYSLSGNIGYTLSKWTDFFVSGSYSGYLQDNDTDYEENNRDHDAPAAPAVDGSSRGWSVHGGFGTYLTERISYRLSGGWSHFEYGDVHNSDGFTYELSFRWSAAERWNVMALAAAYYAPSERDYGTSTRNDTLSIGVSRGLIRGKLSATLDLNYRHESCEYASYEVSDYDMDIITGRVGLNYTLNRFVSFYGNVEYQDEMCSGSKVGNKYDFDRWRLSVGVRFAY